MGPQGPAGDSHWGLNGNDTYYTEGNVAIGTDNPETRLHIYQGAGGSNPASTYDPLVIESDNHAYLNIITPSNKSSGIFFSDDFRNQGSITYDHIYDRMSFGTVRSKRLTIDSDGRIGIGTMFPVAELEVKGNIKADKVIYSSPRTYYYAVSGDEFSPRTNSGSTYRRAYGNGGAYMLSGSEMLMTGGVHLPQGAVITEFEGFFYDSDTGKNLTAVLYKKWFASGYTSVAEVTSSGISGFGSNSDSSIGGPSTVDNKTGTYQVHVFATNWSTSGSKLTIMGALVTYTLDEAQ